MRVVYYFLFVLSFLPLVSFFSSSGLPHTHDGPVHLARMAAYYKSLSDWQFPVRWAGDLNYGYGMPLFNFIYQLPYLLSSILLFLGLGLVDAFKITIALSFILSGVCMYSFARELFKDEKKAFLVAVFYQFAPFRLVELLVRGSLGEVFTYTFLPLTLFGITLLFRKVTFLSIFLTSIGTALLVLSHNALSLVFFAICVLFVLFLGKTRRLRIFGLSSLALGLLLTAFYWVPAIMEHKYTYGNLFMKDMYLSHFPPFFHLFIPNIFNIASLQTGGISVQVGFFHTIALVLGSIFFLHKGHKSREGKIIVFSLLLSAVAFFFMQPISKFIWEHVSLLRQFQFPWRFLGVTVFASSLLSVSFFSLGFFKKTWLYVLFIIVMIASTAYYWYPPLGFDKIDEGYYWNYPLNTTYFGETDLIWSAGPASTYPKQRLEVIGGEGTIANFVKKTQLHTFFLDATTDVQLVDHTQYFPGWRVYVGGVQVPIMFQDPNWRGEITFNVPKGKHEVKVVFGESIVRALADMASLLGILILGGLGIPRVRKIYEVS